MLRAKEYILEHPDESKEQQAASCGCSVSYIGMARRILIAEGKLQPSRKNMPKTSDTLAKHYRDGKVEPALAAVGLGTAAATPDSAPAPGKGATLRDDAAMLELGRILDQIENMDEAEVHQRLLKQCLRFAFDPNLHPDTRMSASTMWAKLRDMTRVRDLGPGNPMTKEDAVARARDVLVAVGPEIALAAINAAFDTAPEVPSEGVVPADARQAAPGAAGASPAP